MLLMPYSPVKTDNTACVM